jgi:ribosomal protein L21E
MREDALKITKSRRIYMATFNIGEKVRIKNQPDWPTPPGFRFAGVEGTVTKSEYGEEVMKDYQHLVFVKVEKTGDGAKDYAGNAFWFLLDQVEKSQ